MEGSEEHSIRQPPQHQQEEEEEEEEEEEQGLGFQGFQSSPPRDPNYDPNIDHQTIDDKLKRIVTQELQNLSLKEAVNEEVQNLACNQASDEELHHLVLKQAIDEALLYKSSNQAIEEERAANQDLTVKLPHLVFRRVIDEALESRALKKNEVHDKETDHEEDDKVASKNEPQKSPVLEENEVNEKTSDHEEDVFQKENEDGNGGDEVKDEDIVDHCEENWSKNESEDGNGMEKVKEEDRINTHEDGWSENDNDDGNGRDESRMNNYEDYVSENDMQDGYNKNENGNDNYEEYTGDIVASKDGKSRRYNYPLRPDAEDCSYYMRTGMCKFGSNCKFNHPLKKKNQAAKESVKQKEEKTERPGQTECKYYMTPGGCKFGKACRYNHNRGKTVVAPIQEFNFLGLPIRPGERECPYYMRNGSCKYGPNCRFNHPDPTAVGGSDPPSRYGNGGSVSLQGAPQTTMPSWSSPRKLNETAPFVPVMYSPIQSVPSPDTEWNGYQAPVYPTSETSLPTPPAFSMNNPTADTNFYPHHQQQMLVEEFPERPGQPECSYFLKTGDCKYRSGCKFHHPKSRIPKAPVFVLSDKGLPLRPDQNICTHYSRYGICKFGPSCKYDHSVNYGNSASSPASGPDHPPPFGNSATAGGARMVGSGNGGESLIHLHL